MTVLKAKQGKGVKKVVSKNDGDCIVFDEIVPTMQHLQAEGKVKELKAYRKNVALELKRCKESLAKVRKFLRDKYGYR